MQRSTRRKGPRILLWLLTLGSLTRSPAFAALPDTAFLSGFETCSAPAQYCADVDQDNYGDIGYCIIACEKPYDFFALSPTDCDNNSSLINPGATEVCDGIDNNCDGQADEGDPGGGSACGTGLLGVCAAGVTQCSSGGLICQQNVQPSAETCDGLDNNCNGQVDEDFPQLGMACSEGLGACAGTGTLVCNAAGNGTQCNITAPGGTPTAEVCNGIDDDCNGLIDDGNPGGGATCVTGLGGTCDPGIITCEGGTLICKATAPGC